MSRCIRLFLVSVGILFPLTLAAQRIRSVRGEYIYYPPETQSMEIARQVAVERAKLQILADTFGTVMQSSNSLRIEQSAGSSGVNTTALTVSEVRGEWVETTDGPVIEPFLSPEGILSLRVRISGRVREIISSHVDTEVQVLRNGTDARYASLEFKEGDDLYLRFKSPIDGNLLVYLYDGNDEVFCLLPYISQSGASAYPVRGLQEYLFFSGDNADEYTMTCSGAQEINRLFILFSPRQLSRAADSKGENMTIPRMLSWEVFNRYLSRMRIADPEMTVQDFMIIISKR